MILFWKKKPKDIKVAVVGNCQARPIAHVLSSLCSKINVNSIGVVHLLKNEEKATYERDFHEADLIFAQRVADNYPCTFVRTQDLKNNYGDKVKVWPNIFYRGYNPEHTLIRMADRKPLNGPLGDYHNQTFIDGWKKGLSIKETLNLYYNIDYNREKYGNIPNLSIMELREREEDCDIKVSTFIEERFREERLFFTFNHPNTALLIHTAKKLIDHAGIRPDRSKYLFKTEPLGKFQPPVNPWVIKEHGLSFNEAPVWKGVKVNGIHGDVVTTGESYKFQDKEIIEIFFQIYSANKEIVYDF